MTPLIQRPELVEKLRRAFSLRESGVGSTISPELVPVVVVEDLLANPIGEGYPRAAIGKNYQAAIAGQYSRVVCENPTQSGVDMYLEMAMARPGTSGANVQLRHATGITGLDATTDNSKQWRDRRAQGRPACRITGKVAVGQEGTVACDFFFKVDELQLLPLGYILPPGSMLQITPSVVNMAIESVVFWEERLRPAP